MGAFMFGFTELMRPVYYSGHAPFRLTGLIEAGSAAFLEGHSIWWPEHISFVDDFWASALNAYHHRFCLVDMRYAIPTQVGQLGGLAGHRTTSQIWGKADFLRTAFGEAVELSDRETFDDTYPWRLRLPWR